MYQCSSYRCGGWPRDALNKETLQNESFSISIKTTTLQFTLQDWFHDLELSLKKKLSAMSSKFDSSKLKIEAEQ